MALYTFTLDWREVKTTCLTNFLYEKGDMDLTFGGSSLSKEYAAVSTLFGRVTITQEGNEPSKTAVTALQGHFLGSFEFI